MGHKLSKFWIVYAALWGAASVGISAYSAHGLAGDEARVVWAETGSTYGFVHILAILILIVLGYVGQEKSKILMAACSCFGLGLLLFSGGLYLKALAEISLGGPFIPIGGSLYILGWLLTALYGLTFKGKGQADG